MKKSFGDFGSKYQDNLPVVARPQEARVSYHSKRSTIGTLPYEYQNKSYMVFGRYNNEVLQNYGHTMGWGIKISVPKIKINVKKLINSIGKAFESVADMVKETIAIARKVVLSVTPPALHRYIDIVINPLPLITNPASTIKKLIDVRPLIQIITNPIPQIAYVLDPKPKLALVNYAYKNVLTPAFKTTMNLTADFALEPMNNVASETVYKAMPKALADKLDRVASLPELAARGKITDKLLADSTMAVVEMGAVPFKLLGDVSNKAINWARNDGILGPVVNTLDKYSGGLVGSYQNIANTGNEVYYSEDISWKKKILDGVKIYLAATGAAAFAQGMATNYVGTQTGLNNTPIGRDVLFASRVYLSGSYTDGGFEFTNAAAAQAGKAVLTDAAKREIIIEAAKKGIIDRGTLTDMVKYGTALYGAKNPDGTYSSEQMVSISKDGVYQEFVREEVKRRTGLDLSLKELTDIYGYAMNPQEVLDNVDAAIEKATEDTDKWKENVDKAFTQAVKDYENFDMKKFIANEMPRFEQNVKDELTRYADGQVEDYIKWAIAKLGPQAAKDPKNFTPELMVEYERTVLDLTGLPVPKKKGVTPMVIGAGVAILAGAAYLTSET